MACGLVLVQPWLNWPGLYPDTSHRLTLVIICVAISLLRMVSGATYRLPRILGAWILLYAAILSFHSWHIVQSGSYFEFFQETALFSDGLLAILSITLGLWGLLQMPAKTFRMMRWVGMLFLLINVSIVIVQLAYDGTAEGAFRVNRFLATYAAVWLPVCLAWHPLAIIPPVAMLLIAQKPLPLIAALLAVVPMIKKRRHLILLSALGVGAWLIYYPAVYLRASQRLLTWAHAIQASMNNALFGLGCSPMVIQNISQQYGYMLPSLHSDWLLLAVSMGWVVTILLFFTWLLVILESPANKWAAACKHSLLIVGLLSFVQETVSYSRILGIVLFIVAWYIVEQREGKELDEKAISSFNATCAC